jgi:hypothetical protein
MTFGNESSYGGILIRGIQNLKTKDSFVDGPSLTVDTILSLNDVSKVEDLAKILKEKHELSIFNDEKYLKISESEDLTNLKVYQSGRVGLTLKMKDNIEKRKEYLLKFYRFFTFPKEIKKGKNYMVSAAIHQGMKDDEISKVFKSTKASVEKFRSSYNTTSDVKDFIGKKLSNDDLALLHGALKEYL